MPKIVLLYLVVLMSFLNSCSISKQITRKSKKIILEDSVFKNAHLGIALFDAEQDKMIYDFQGEKYFVPASNVKIVTCYAAMKLLTKELPGINYFETDTAIILIPTGDPTLLHPDFSTHPVADFLAKSPKKLYIADQNWQDQALAPGWSWDDFSESFMVERSSLPVYGNVTRWSQVRTKKENPVNNTDTIDSYVYSEPDIYWGVNFKAPQLSKPFSVKRNKGENVYTITEGLPRSAKLEVPFVTEGLKSAITLFRDTIHKELSILNSEIATRYPELKATASELQTIYSHSTDSLLRLMIYRSDNFYAEQILLMLGNVLVGKMNDENLIDRLLNNELKAFPQKPRWVDGSGLSRYNLYSPRDFVWILDKMRKEFDWERIKWIFPTGGSGTLRNFFRQDSGYIFAKTGSLSGVVSLSGFLVTKRRKTIIFSVLVNNNTSNSTAIRRRVEELLSFVRERY
jgi:D-alanyl-D-alanine carboxypeptidase/D-alanyl-D-alanine-endopeptidase (penicillin-binding protein 4)